jgi:hypothetical protein
MAEIDRYKTDDKRQIETLYRRVFGNDMADANRLRWEWQYHKNPNVPPSGPLIWVAREGQAIVGQYATMPVRVGVNGAEVDASWGMDVMVAPSASARAWATCSSRPGIATWARRWASDSLSRPIGCS